MTNWCRRPRDLNHQKKPIIIIITLVRKFHDQETHRKVTKVTTRVTLGISSLWDSLLSGGRYFQSGRYFWGTKIVKSNYTPCQVLFLHRATWKNILMLCGIIIIINIDSFPCCKVPWLLWSHYDTARYFWGAHYFWDLLAATKFWRYFRGVASFSLLSELYGSLGWKVK